MAKENIFTTPSILKCLVERYGLLLLFGVMYLSSSSCRDRPSTPPKAQPPDIRQCSRVEIHYVTSILDRFFPTDWTRTILNGDETQCLESLQQFILDKPAETAAFADLVAHTTYVDTTPRVPASAPLAEVVCFGNGGRRITLRLTEQFLITEDKRYFRFPGTGFDLLRFTPQIEPFVVRLSCARHLAILSQFLKEQGVPLGDDWCDGIVQALETASNKREPDESTTRLFQCPAVSNGECNYAMNPGCTIDSPPDAVFLFEAKAGWNQHGGPELFTFDNHDPKGGLVLLNDGTVKFIRTEEELKQLRWK
jgi:hypothetical protein